MPIAFIGECNLMELEVLQNNTRLERCPDHRFGLVIVHCLVLSRSIERI